MIIEQLKLVMGQLNDTKAWVDEWEKAASKYVEDAGAFLELAEESGDESHTADVDNELNAGGKACLRS